MKLLLDQGLPRSSASLLRQADIDAIHVSEIGYATATDTSILELGRREKRIVVTLDADFHAHLALSGAAYPSVIRIRIEGLRGQALAELLERLVRVWDEELELGAILTVQENRVRMRRLPLI